MQFFSYQIIYSGLIRSPHYTALRRPFIYFFSSSEPLCPPQITPLTKQTRWKLHVLLFTSINISNFFDPFCILAVILTKTN